MIAKLGSWLGQMKQHQVAIGVVGITLVVVIALVIVGYRFDWTGFNGYNQVTTASIIRGPSAGTITRTEVYQPGKVLWDWLQLLIVPLVLAVGALLFNLATTRAEQKIASDKQREDLLQAYLDRMSELLLEKNLRTSQPYTEVRNVARVRTITVLFRLDARRIAYVFAFLREAGLMSNKPDSSIVSLSEADLSGANLSKARLWYADLSGAYLGKADLSGADLSEANLSKARLRYTNLIGAYLGKADLSGADLRYADLRYADLRYADLSEANLSEANLRRANLKDASGITIEELEKQARLLRDAIMPDGSKHP